MSASSLSYVYVKDPVSVYKPMRVVSTNSDRREYCIQNIQSIGLQTNDPIVTVKIDDTYPIASLDELTNPPPDLIKLMIVNLPGILNSLRHRFERDLIYTSVGPILVALNPFKWIKGTYDESVMMQYFKEEINLSSHPHVFAITTEAFQGIKDQVNQSLIISGESGAGIYIQLLLESSLLTIACVYRQN